MSPAHDPLPFTSQYTSNFPAILEDLGISLAVSTYQAGKLIFIRSDAGKKLNTHFRPFDKPMGIAFDPTTEQLAIGTRNAVCEFHNQPAVAPKLGADAAFLPRSTHYSGDIRIHEIAYLVGELWAVNTRFSCLCTFSKTHSFAPRWRPPFITALAPEDRCHLNGLALADNAPRYVTALGTTDTADGWRENKVSGGLIIDVPSGEIIARGLAMPHSPRLHADKLWVLESGTGRVCIVDPASGKTEVFAELPGFTRGLDFCGPYAFVGLSQVRETAVFSGLPICAPGRERQCGVWVLDIRTAETVAFLRFSGSVQEVFAVQVLPSRSPS